jgi:hypothetical protein
MITSRHIQPSNFWGLVKQVGPWKTTSTDLAHEAEGYDSPHNQVQEVRPFQQNGTSPKLTWTTPKIVDPGNLRGFKVPGIARFGDRAPLGRNVQVFNQQFFNGPSGEAEVLKGKVPSTTLPTKTVSARSEIKREAARDAERVGQIGSQRAPPIPSQSLKPDFTKSEKAALDRLKEQMTGESDLRVDTSDLFERLDEFLVTEREADESAGFSIRGTREDLTKIPQPVVAPPPVKQEVADRVVEVFVPVEEMMAVDPLTVQDVVPEKGLSQFIDPGTGLVLRKKSLTFEDISEPFIAKSPRHFGKSRNLLKAGKIGANKALMNRINANSGQLQVAFRVPKDLPPVTRAVVKKKTPTKRDVAVAVKKGELVPAERRSILGKEKEVFVARKKFIVKK